MLTRKVLGLALGALFLMGSTFTFVTLAGADAVGGIMPTKAYASTDDSFDLNDEDGFGVANEEPEGNGDGSDSDDGDDSESDSDEDGDGGHEPGPH